MIGGAHGIALMGQIDLELTRAVFADHGRRGNGLSSASALDGRQHSRELVQLVEGQDLALRLGGAASRCACDLGVGWIVSLGEGLHHRTAAVVVPLGHLIRHERHQIV